jgi:hypothetical protein
MHVCTYNPYLYLATINLDLELQMIETSKIPYQSKYQQDKP